MLLPCKTIPFKQQKHRFWAAKRMVCPNGLTHRQLPQHLAGQLQGNQKGREASINSSPTPFPIKA